MPTTFNTDTPKPGYVYDSVLDTWFPLAGIAVQTLDGLTDVVISSAASGQTIVYNGTNWVNASETGDVSAISSGTGITVTNGTGPIPSIAIDTATTVDLNTAQTLTNKTLTTPIISTISNTGTVTLPTATDTLVGRATTDTLTNKTLTSAIQEYSVLVTPEERFSVTSVPVIGTVNLDTLTAGVYYSTGNATGNWTLNLRGSSATSLNSILTINDSVTVVLFATQGGTAYYQTALTIDGNAITPKWQNGTAPSAGNTNSIDIYSFTIVKTANATFTAFGSQTKFA